MSKPGQGLHYTAMFFVAVPLILSATMAVVFPVLGALGVRIDSEGWGISFWILGIPMIFVFFVIGGLLEFFSTRVKK
jgi:hypothetical protein